MKRPDIEAIIQRHSHSTPGEWATFQGEDLNSEADYDGIYPRWRGVAAAGEEIVEKCGGEGYSDRVLNADFIAAAHQDIPELCGYVKHLEARIAALESK